MASAAREQRAGRIYEASGRLLVDTTVAAFMKEAYLTEQQARLRSFVKNRKLNETRAATLTARSPATEVMYKRLMGACPKPGAAYTKVSFTTVFRRQNPSRYSNLIVDDG